MSRPGLWLYLLGAVTFLVIVLRRVLQRMRPLNEELYAKQVAIEHVQSGVAWVRADGTVVSVNPALCRTLRTTPRDLVGRQWSTLFLAQEWERVQDTYSQALLRGRMEMEGVAKRGDGTLAPVTLLLVTVHDHKSSLIGHYCLMEDRTRLVELEEQLQKTKSAQPA